MRYITLLTSALFAANTFALDEQNPVPKAAGFWQSIFDESDHIAVKTTLYTMHFDPKPEHNNTQKLIDLQWHWNSQYLAGFSFFRNSFYQPTQFAYAGRSWDIPNTAGMLYVSLLGGFLHGYDGEHKENIPLNDHGIAPAILPTFGLRYSHIHSELLLFGTSGLSLTIGVDFPLK